ncbi:RagB/SusD family nutrient uptake outer membrane protein [Dysgonomonas sp. Marseille-P4361]|uniref:RagB/SusD family nutrient uptake outer membrane protein n=1 Tax=Dysgonomonas sp. Marseille-P4361 TaxID=2161820 RepID=UPI0021010FFE|nr:RagB/SusD family nutrient uptake outer membrane protein [Dysgonomonas sp. Marseille-P4361]
MKKKYIKFLLSIVVITSSIIPFSSCSDYLDVDKYFDDIQNIDSAFTRRVYAEGFLSNIYDILYVEMADIPTGSVGQGGYLLFASDDIIRNSRDGICQKYQNGEYSSENTLEEDKWKRLYEPVRKATTFIKYIDNCKELTMNERADLKAQGYFIRGYAYWTLLRQYGPLPMIPEEGFEIDMSYDELSVQRNTFDECVDIIEKDFIIAAQTLPMSRTATNIGRPTKGAALAARARLLNLAASPLFNGNKDLFSLKNYDGVQLINQEYDEKKWAKAAAAAKSVIDLGVYELYTFPYTTGTTIAPPYHEEYSNKPFPEGWQDIDPYASYKYLFDGNAYPSKHKEIIFHRPNRANLNDLTIYSMPYSLGGDNTIAVTQKQVDAYYLNDGRTIDEGKSDGYYKESGFTSSAAEYAYLPSNVSLRYANREPRFYASIAYNGCIWECLSASEDDKRNKQIFYYKGSETDGKDFARIYNYPVTGYSLKKYYNPQDSRTTGGSMERKFEPAIRYAEILMLYAEALNELTTSHTVASYSEDEMILTRSVEELRTTMKPIRMRVGLPDYKDNIYKDQQIFRATLKKERQIELFAEGKRYYDLRRWKDAEVEENLPIMGCNVEMPNTGIEQREAFHVAKPVASFPKIFLKESMYLWPIPKYELRRNKRLTQNPGW